jgi:O-antigen ligase
MRLRLTPNELGNVIMMMFFGTFYYIPILMPSTEGIASIQSQAGQYAGVARVLLFGLWVCICFQLFRARFQIRYDLFAARCAIAYACFGAVSALWCNHPASALSTGFQVLMASLYAVYLVSRFSYERLLIMLSWVVMILAVLSAIFAIALPQYGRDHFSNAGAWQGVFAQKNSLSVVMIYGVSIVMALRCRNLADRAWKYGLLFLCILEAIMSQSREAWAIGLMMVALQVGFNFLSRMAVRSRATALLILFLSAAVSVILAVINREAVLRLLGRDATLRGRTGVWTAVIQICEQHPLKGVGIGSFWGTPAASRIDMIVGWAPTSSHNGFLEALLTLGVIGLSLLVSIFAIGYLSGLKIVTNQADFSRQTLWMRFIFTISIFNFVQTSTGTPASISWILFVGSACVLEANRVYSVVRTQEEQFAEFEAALLTAS